MNWYTFLLARKNYNNCAADVRHYVQNLVAQVSSHPGDLQPCAQMIIVMQLSDCKILSDGLTVSLHYYCVAYKLELIKEHVRNGIQSITSVALVFCW